MVNEKSAGRISATALALFVCYTVISVACVNYYRSVAPSPDQSLYDYIAWQGIEGVPWYVGSFDVTWPGPLFVAEIGIRTFGVHPWTARVTDFIFLQAAVAGIYFFLNSAKLRSAAVAAAMAYPIIYVTSGGWMAGHRDIVAMHLLIISSALLLNATRHNWFKLLLAGIAIGYAVMLRPTYLAFAPAGIAIWFSLSGREISRETGKSVAVLSLGILLPATLFLAAGLLLGTFSGWIDACRFVLSVYQDQNSRWLMIPRIIDFFKVYVWWLAVAAFISLFLWKRKPMGAHLALLFSMSLTSLLSFVVQNKGFGYHLGGLIPLLVIFSFGSAEIGLSADYKSLRFSNFAAAIVVLILCTGTASRVRNNFFLAAPPPSEHERFALIAQRESSKTDVLFQWGWNLDFLVEARRHSASRFVATPVFSQIKLGDPIYTSWLKQFESDLENNRPHFILLDLNTVPPKSESNAALQILQSQLAKNYEVRDQTADAVLYQRRSD